MKNHLRIFLVTILSFVTSSIMAKEEEEDRMMMFNPVEHAVISQTIAPDARSAGMGDVGAATEPDVYSQYWNPAKYPFCISRAGVGISYTPWLRKLVGYIYLANVSGYYRIGDYSAISASLRYFSLGEVFTDDGGDMTVKPYEMSFDAAYSMMLSEKFSLAAAIRWIYSDLRYDYREDSKPASAFAADLAMYYNTYFNWGPRECQFALGVNISQSPAKCVELLKEVGMCFFFAQKYHTSMKYVGAIRKELGFRTVFNILGPLTNPASPAMQLLGVYDGYLAEPLTRVLTSLGVKRGMVVYGQDKLDEISLSSPTTICEIKDGWYKTYVIAPEDFGFERCKKEDLKGGTPAENAQITLDILNGVKGHKRNAVLLNAGAALYIGGKAKDVKEGVVLAAELIDSGKALATLQNFIEFSNRPE